MKSFRPFRLDTENQCLWRGEERVPMPPKAYDVLRHFVENPGRLITQDEILEKLWTDTYVNPEVLRKYILDIRKILGDRRNKPEFIETVTKRGYRFIAHVVDESATEPPDSPTSHAKQEHLTDENVEHETAHSEQEGSSGRRRLWKLALIPVLSVVAAAGMGAYFRLVRNANATSSKNPSIADRRAALCGHEPGQKPGIFFRWARRTIDSRAFQSVRTKGRRTLLSLSVPGQERRLARCGSEARRGQYP